VPSGARVIVLEGSGVYLVREVDLPDPGPGQVLLQVLAAGIGAPQVHRVVEPPGGLTLAGDEGVARVLACGPGVEGLSEGDLVAVTPFGAPGDRTVTVELDEGETEPSASFTFATNAVVDARRLVPMADLRDREALAVLGATALTGLAAIEFGDSLAGRAVAVFGVSGTGLSAVVAAREAGAAVIIAIDRDDRRLALARSLGAAHTVKATTAAALAEVMVATGGRGVDLLVDCPYDYRTKDRPGARPLAVGGVAVLAGLPGTESEADALDRIAAAGGYQRIDPASVNAAALVAHAREWAGSGALPLGSIVTARYTIEAVNEAVRDLENGDIVGQGILVIEPLR
jgi:Zn-dependent alcohol dehydrogenase